VGGEKKVCRAKTKRLRKQLRVRSEKLPAFLLRGCRRMRDLFLEPLPPTKLSRNLFAQGRHGKPTRPKFLFKDTVVCKLRPEKAKLALHLRRID
jgi:hypothetical protein